jgi:hypothetical protein
MHFGRSHVLGCRLNGPVPEVMYINPAEGDGLVWMVAGEKHKTGQGVKTEERYRRLELYARGRFDVQSIELD